MRLLLNVGIDRCHRYRGYVDVEMSETPRLRVGLNAAAATAAIDRR
ncbi:hypothetical protein SH528x_003159 [Novipirellula sp. SH528]